MDSIIIYRDVRDSLAQLPPEMFQKVMLALFDYGFDQKEPEEDTDNLTMALFLAFKGRLDADAQRLERARNNGKKGGNPNFKTGKRNPYYPKGEEADEAAQADNQEITKDNPKITQAAQADNREITKDKLYPYPYNNIVVAVEGAHAHACEEDYKNFLEVFFSDEKRAQVEALCMQLRTNTETLRTMAEEVVNEWLLTEATHEDYKAAAQHLINQIRIKHKANKNDTASKDRQKRGKEDRPGELRGSATPARKLRSTL